MEFQDYKRYIAELTKHNVNKMVQTTPQPTMFGGKRARKYVLAGTTEYDYPSTLGVGNISKEKPKTLGGAFWNDMGDNVVKALAMTNMGAGMKGADGQGVRNVAQPVAVRKIGADGHGIYNPVHHGAVVSPVNQVFEEPVFPMAQVEGGKRRRGRPAKAPMAGGSGWDDFINTMKDVGHAVAPVVLPALTEVAKDALKGYMGGTRKRPPTKAQIERLKKHVLKGGFGWNDIVEGLKSIGHEVMPVIAPIAKEFIKKKGTEMANDYLNGSGRKRGRPRKMKGGDWIDDLKNIGSTLGKPFEVAKVNPFDLGYELGNKVIGPAIFGKGGKRGKKAGALIMNKPAEFVNSVYPPALQSYQGRFLKGGGGGEDDGNRRYLEAVAEREAKQARDFEAEIKKQAKAEKAKKAYEKRKLRKMSEVSDMSKSFYDPSTASQGKGIAKAPRKPSARGAIVAKIMKEKGLSLPQASKYVKYHKLY